MRIPKIRDNGQWIIPRTYVRSGGAWILVDNFIRNAGDWGDELVIYITSNSENVNVQSLFGGYWTQNVPKRLIINPGVVVGSLDPGAYALTIPGGVVSTLRIDNNGSIQGAGGSPIPFSAGNGGPAIYAGSAVTIDNIGSIYGGGGSGGFGGTGGDGGYYYECFETSAGGYSGTVFGDWGGSGGQGQGYAQNATGGDAGYPSITYCGDGSGCDYIDENGDLVSGSTVCYSEGVTGAGGAGGGGGSFGNNGGPGLTGASGNATGGQGGYSGGLAGYYIVNNANVTWTTLGTVAGRVG